MHWELGFVAFCHLHMTTLHILCRGESCFAHCDKLGVASDYLFLIHFGFMSWDQCWGQMKRRMFELVSRFSFQSSVQSTSLLLLLQAYYSGRFAAQRDLFVICVCVCVQQLIITPLLLSFHEAWDWGGCRIVVDPNPWMECGLQLLLWVSKEVPLLQHNFLLENWKEW